MTQNVNESNSKPIKGVQYSLVKHIKQATGLSMGQFCERELNTDYKAFHYRLKNSRLHADEIFYMVWRTKKTVQELFGKGWHELILDNSNGPIVDKVKDIIAVMSPEEAQELDRLMGLDKNRAMRVAEILTDHPKPKPKLNLTPLTPDEATAEDSEEERLKSLFKNTYNFE